MAKILKIRFDRAHSAEQGCICDRCGQWLKNIWTVKFDDGITAHFGIDCYEQMCKDSRLTEYGMKLMKKATKKLSEWYERMEEEKALTEATDTAYQNEQRPYNSDGYWYGKPWEEYHEWVLSKWYPARIADCEKDLAKFKNVNFKR